MIYNFWDQYHIHPSYYPSYQYTLFQIYLYPVLWLKITFDHPVNSSLQVGDAIYVSDIVDGITSEPVYVQKVIELGGTYIVVDKDPAVTPIITNGQYILFAKSIF